MRAKVFGVFGIILLVGWIGSGWGQSDELMRAYQQGVEFYQAGRYAEAEPYFEVALKLAEREFGPEHPNVAGLLSYLGLLYHAQGRYAEAEPLFRRALVIFEKALGPDHPNVATSLNNLAELYRAQGRYAEAELLYRRALAIREKALEPEHPDVAISLNNLAGLYDAQGRYAEAEPLYRRALAIKEKTLGPEPPDVATSLNNLAGLYDAQGRYTEAEPLYRRALAIVEKALGPEHPDAALSLSNLAFLYKTQGQSNKALQYSRRAVALLGTRFGQTTSRRGRGVESEQRTRQGHFLIHLDVISTLLTQTDQDPNELTGEAFTSAQFARLSSAGQSIDRMAARFAAQDDTLGRVVRDYQDTLAQSQALDSRLLEAIGQERPEVTTVERLRTELADREKQLTALEATLSEQFPDYADLVAPRPVALPDLQPLLAENEAVLVYLVSALKDNEKTYLWVVRRDSATMLTLAIDGEELDQRVRALRAGLDLPPDVGSVEGLKAHPFDTRTAFALYQALVAPAEPLLDGVTHLLVIPDGALQSLPLGVLVTAEPPEDQGDFGHYRETPWLANRYALSTLPSVSSLRALRRAAQNAKGDKPLVGFGNPLLKESEESAPDEPRGLDPAALFSYRGLANPEALRELERLDNAVKELEDIAHAVGGDLKDLYLGKHATETQVRRLDLDDYRLVAFATHALVAGDFPEVAEPGLVLTPPETATEADDGLLTASEISQLELDADWVILSACNTAAADGTPGAEALSGLARAFFYAGSRAMLVSHWSVFSSASIRLTTATFQAMVEDPAVGRAEALRRAMLTLLNDPEEPHFAHPAFWAPFVVVGEGGGSGQIAQAVVSAPSAPQPPKPEPVLFVTLKNANVRAEPTTDSPRVTTLPAGTQVEVLETVGDGSWSRVARDGENDGLHVFAAARAARALTGLASAAKGSRQSIALSTMIKSQRAPEKACGSLKPSCLTAGRKKRG